MKKLTNIDKAFNLKKIYLFKKLDLEVLIAIADKAEELFFREGDEIFHQKQDANHMYFVIEGVVKITPPQTTSTIDQHHFFGEESLFNEKPREYSAYCLADCHLLTLSKGHLLTIIYEFPSVAVQFLKHLYR
ncbi:MAG: cyclic nucleotide-binding domain-containing protein [Chlamydiota bacterium]